MQLRVSMLNFIFGPFKNEKPPENELLPEEKDRYFKLLTALSQGDFNTLKSVFPHDNNESFRLFTIGFEKYLNDLEKSPTPELQEVLNNQISLRTFLKKMHQS